MKSQNRVSNNSSIVLMPKEKPIFVSYHRNVIVLWCLKMCLYAKSYKLDVRVEVKKHSQYYFLSRMRNLSGRTPC